mmetsp:Transcript_25929/g.62548  ORF Transcript_25929/g.62548 Transcript_25929/m.62548 type:complete len:139 (+) Transcript_25929:52-468(+)
MPTAPLHFMDSNSRNRRVWRKAAERMRSDERSVHSCGMDQSMIQRRLRQTREAKASDQAPLAWTKAGLLRGRRCQCLVSSPLSISQASPPPLIALQRNKGSSTLHASQVLHLNFKYHWEGGMRKHQMEVELLVAAKLL